MYVRHLQDSVGGWPGLVLGDQIPAYPSGQTAQNTEGLRLSQELHQHQVGWAAHNSCPAL